DYSLWSGPAPLLPITRPKFHYDWHWQWAYGNGDLGNQGIHQMDLARWALGVSDVGDGVQSYGGRVGYEDAGETANTQVCIHSFGDKRLVFEVRGLPTQKYRGAGVGVIVYGTEGVLVLPSYDGGVVYDNDGKEVTTFKGGADRYHFENFVQAVRSRKHADLNADILEGHLSSALCHLGNISYRMGTKLAAAEIKERLSGDAEKKETFERLAAHLADNKLDPATTQLTLGAALKVDGKNETLQGASEEALAMLTREYRTPFVVPAAGKV
ncbi:MAG: gfo/Idh/MocA family oxidoreductase, partial [Planctomycetia bacterium]|nr:gfo/Idh/MocA family oxidoreductase [Planctomycetia bacterium]